MATAEGAYRCARCRSWRHLLAWAAALVEGPLDAEGKMIDYGYVEDCYLHEDSIHCTRHIDAPVEMFHQGRWCRWWSCPRCRGWRRVDGNGFPSRETGRYSYQCNQGIPATGWHDGLIHEGWLPARRHEELMAAQQARLTA